jgi:ribonuclease HI
MLLFSDGSGTGGHVGSAAVWFKDGRAHRTLHFHLGNVLTHSVFESEIVGILLALEIIRKAGRTMPRPICINLDNQSAIRASLTNRASSGQHLICALNHSALRLMRSVPRAPPITIQWVAAHSDVPGHDLADSAAKAAAEGKSSTRQALPPVL